MGFILLILIGLIMLVLTDDDFIRFILSILLTMAIFTFAFCSEVIVRHMMSLYEEGKIVKECTIVGQDTTYRWILK